MPSSIFSFNYIKKIFWRAAQVPLIYLLLSLLFFAASILDDVFPIGRWKRIFDFTDKVGNMFLALAIITFIYKLTTLLFKRYERKLHEHYKITSLILGNIRKGFRVIYILVALSYIVIELSPTQIYLTLANNIINTAIIASIGWIAAQVFYTVEAVIYQYMMTLTNEDHVRAKALYTKMHILRNIATVIIIVITFATILMSFSSFKNIGISLLASAGFLTAMLGLSAQKTLFSLFSGLQIALSQPIKIGDVVLIEHESGLIEEITFTYVTLKLGDRRRLVVPINYFIEKPFENWSRDYDSLRSSIHFFVDYLMPIEPLRQAFNDILLASPYWDGRAMKLQVANLTNHAVELRVQVSASNADNLSDLKAEVREKILTFIREYYPEHLPKIRNHGDMGVRDMSLS